MSRPLIISDDAEDDLREASAWYEPQREGLGDEIMLCIEHPWNGSDDNPIMPNNRSPAFIASLCGVSRTPSFASSSLISSKS